MEYQIVIKINDVKLFLLTQKEENAHLLKQSLSMIKYTYTHTDTHSDSKLNMGADFCFPLHFFVLVKGYLVNWYLLKGMYYFLISNY